MISNSPHTFNAMQTGLALAKESMPAYMRENMPENMREGLTEKTKSSEKIGEIDVIRQVTDEQVSISAKADKPSGSDVLFTGSPAQGSRTQGSPTQDSLNKNALTYDALATHAKKPAEKGAGDTELEQTEQKEVEDLKARDTEVRLHEQAHAAVGGQYAGSPSYEYETGPDGRQYAVGGEVSIDVSEENEPEDTVSKMQVVRAAALAPAEPSTQDYKVAAEASQKEQRARAEVAKQSVSGEDDSNGEGKAASRKGNAEFSDSINQLASDLQARNQQAVKAYENTFSSVSKAFTSVA